MAELAISTSLIVSPSCSLAIRSCWPGATMQSPSSDVENYHIPDFNKSPVYHLTTVGHFVAPWLALFMSTCVLISEQAAHLSYIFSASFGNQAVPFFGFHPHSSQLPCCWLRMGLRVVRCDPLIPPCLDRTGLHIDRRLPK